MLRIAVLFLVLFVSSAAHAEGPETSDSAAEAAVESMSMPRLEARVQARAAAYRLFQKTVGQLGFGVSLVQDASLNGRQFAAAKRRLP